MDEITRISSDESDEEHLTAKTILEKLGSAWLNEKFSPEILQHQSEIVDCMLDQVHQMEVNLARLKRNDFRVSIHKMELDRVRYVVASYLRTRLEKIENFAVGILEEESKRSAETTYLSTNEVQFAEVCVSLLERHFQIALRHMPSNLQTFEKTKMCMKPNVYSHVFLRAKRDVLGVIVEGDSDNKEEEVDLDVNTQHIMQYQPVSHLVKNGNVQLI